MRLPQSFLDGLAKFVADLSAFLKGRQASQNEPGPAPVPEPAPIPLPPPPAPPALPTDLLETFLEVIQEYEGWGPPDSVINGVRYPDGTPAWRNKNPGNLRCSLGNRPSWNVLAIGSANNFCIFKDEATGKQALKNVTIAVCHGQSATYSTQGRKLFGVANCADLTLLQYFTIRDPVADQNDPNHFAATVGKRLGVDYRTFKMKQII